MNGTNNGEQRTEEKGGFTREGILRSFWCACGVRFAPRMRQRFVWLQFYVRPVLVGSSLNVLFGSSLNVPFRSTFSVLCSVVPFLVLRS